jgi:hypothetical protein
MQLAYRGSQGRRQRSVPKLEIDLDQQLLAVHRTRETYHDEPAGIKPVIKDLTAQNVLVNSSVRCKRRKS